MIVIMITSVRKERNLYILCAIHKRKRKQRKLTNSCPSWYLKVFWSCFQPSSCHFFKAEVTLGNSHSYPYVHRSLDKKKGRKERLWVCVGYMGFDLKVEWVILFLSDIVSVRYGGNSYFKASWTLYNRNN